ncbi:fungal-specific transcription factor domain-containing protein [Hyaloraphidium curvatum]|nr:fungal-specific transcription factor domain-containing protein [Hyaloraphidium curvatum]
MHMPSPSAYSSRASPPRSPYYPEVPAISIPPSYAPSWGSATTPTAPGFPDPGLATMYPHSPGGQSTYGIQASYNTSFFPAFGYAALSPHPPPEPAHASLSAFAGTAAMLPRIENPAASRGGSAAPSTPQPQDPPASKAAEGAETSGARSTSVPDSLSVFDALPPMPPQECLNELVGLYFNNIHHYQPFLHKPTILRTFSTLPPLLQLSVYAAASCFSKDSRVSPMNLYNRAKAQYKMEMDRPSNITTVQAILLLIMTTVRIGVGSQAVFWSALCQSMAKHLHLFADPDLQARRSVPRGFVSFQDRSNMSWIEKETERRTFWAAVMVDRLHATAVSVFCGIKEEDIFVALPCHDLIWNADLPADSGVDPTGIPISVLLNDHAPELAQPQTPEEPAQSAFGRVGDSVIPYTSGVTQPLGPFAHTAKLYLAFGKLVDHRCRCRCRNVSHLADPEISAALHGWRSQLPAWVIELDDSGRPGIPKLGEDVRWGYSVLIKYHYLLSLLFGPGEFRDWVGEKFFSEEAGLLWVASSLMVKCLDSVKRVSRMMAFVRDRSEDPDVLEFGGPFLPYCTFQLGMVGLVGMRAASLGLIGPEYSADFIKGCVETLVWTLQKQGKTNRSGNRLASHLAKLLEDVGEFNGQFPAVDLIDRMEQRKFEFLQEMERTNPYRKAYADELIDSSLTVKSKSSPGHAVDAQSSRSTVSLVANGPSTPLSPPQTARSELPPTEAAAGTRSDAAMHPPAAAPASDGLPTASNALYLQFLRSQGIGGIMSYSDLDGLINENSMGPISSTAFTNARTH